MTLAPLHPCLTVHIPASASCCQLFPTQTRITTLAHPVPAGVTIRSILGHTLLLVQEKAYAFPDGVIMCTCAVETTLHMPPSSCDDACSCDQLQTGGANLAVGSNLTVKFIDSFSHQNLLSHLSHILPSPSNPGWIDGYLVAETIATTPFKVSIAANFITSNTNSMSFSRLHRTSASQPPPPQHPMTRHQQASN